MSLTTDEEEARLRDTTEITSLTQYLKVKSENLWLYLSLLFIWATLSVIYAFPYESPLRGVLGSIFVIFLPGYTMMKALFVTDKELAPMLRIALSVVFSIVITYLHGFLINYTLWRIETDYIIVSLSVFTVSTAFIGVYRRYKHVTENSS